MFNGDLITNTYLEAVNGLSKKVLENCESWYQYVLNLPVKQQVSYTVVLFDSQVNNGGFHQYFYNSYGMFAQLAVKNLNLINSHRRAEMLKTALNKVNDENLEDKLFRQAIFHQHLLKIVEFDDELFYFFNQLDYQYYNYDEDLNSLLEAYLLKE